jgi:mannose-6-phosphate isomerase
MNRIATLRNTIQEYDWGSKTAIPELLGESAPAIRPQAELWLGAHPKASSFVYWEGRWVSLLELIERAPEEMLGKGAAKRFYNRLPFLFKVLAAATPLPIQVHPDQIQAKGGFARENNLGIPLQAFHRNYVDDSHKPEMICALSSFWALRGFRRSDDLIQRLRETCSSTLKNEISSFEQQADSVGLKVFIENLVKVDSKRKHELIREAVSSARKEKKADPAMQWLVMLHEQYPDDVWAISPILLNTIRLEPGEALFIAAREPHAYLGGVGMELMANSDNTIRGGLTTRHTDIDEFVRILDFEGRESNVIRPCRLSSSEEVYPTEAKEFMLTRIRVRSGLDFVHSNFSGIEIMLCTEGKARIIGMDGKEFQINRGSSLVIPAAVSRYRIEGDATLFKATVPS